MSDKKAQSQKDQLRQREKEANNLDKPELPTPSYTKLLGEGTWKSPEKKPYPDEGDELEIPKHPHHVI
ncbi:MAG: hypothetical protein P4M14_05150 [Gammaproteobacteria bacterium]|nr:hypothetical protein [Gammaproteobacteria bacterium]